MSRSTSLLVLLIAAIALITPAVFADHHDYPPTLSPKPNPDHRHPFPKPPMRAQPPFYDDDDNHDHDHDDMPPTSGPKNHHEPGHRAEAPYGYGQFPAHPPKLTPGYKFPFAKPPVRAQPPFYDHDDEHDRDHDDEPPTYGPKRHHKPGHRAAAPYGYGPFPAYPPMEGGYEGSPNPHRKILPPRIPHEKPRRPYGAPPPDYED